jgi:preprotein translocase SecE subunit
MAVAVKNTPDTGTTPAGFGFAAECVTGAVFVLAALAAVALGIPYLWRSSGLEAWVLGHVGTFANVAALLVLVLFTIGVLWALATFRFGVSAPAGLRAGVFTVVAAVLGIAIVVSAVGAIGRDTVSDSIAAAVGAALAFGAWWFLADARFPDRMRTFEEQGFFTAAGFKPTQGRRVRRATMLGLLVMAACGVWTLLNHHVLDGVAKDWQLRVPFLGTMVTLLPDVRLTLPLLLAALAFWLSYRVVHIPTFAEFLVATEAELNKVAWPSRRSLLQDTIVVLVTVVLMTLFLFLVDVAWGKILSNPYVGVLRFDASKTQTEQVVKEPEW